MRTRPCASLLLSLSRRALKKVLFPLFTLSSLSLLRRKNEMPSTIAHLSLFRLLMRSLSLSLSASYPRKSLSLALYWSARSLDARCMEMVQQYGPRRNHGTVRLKWNQRRELRFSWREEREKASLSMRPLRSVYRSVRQRRCTPVVALFCQC